MLQIKEAEQVDDNEQAEEEAQHEAEEAAPEGRVLFLETARARA